jgi:hypothetical protein
MEICETSGQKTGLQKLLELVREIDRLLAEKEQRLQGVASNE